MKEILSEIQRSIDDLQQKLNLLRGVQTGTLYDVDVLMTRKEAAFFLGKSLRQLDRLCSEGQIRRCYTDRGAVRIRRSELLPQSRMTPSSIALWYGLMHIFNKAGWPEEKTVSLDQLKQDTKLSKASIYRERTRLQNEGLITFVAGSGSRPCAFRMPSISKELASQIGTLEFHSETPQMSKNDALESQIEPPLSQIETPASSIPYKENINLSKQEIENNKRKSGSNSSPNSERSVKTSSKSKKEKSSAQKEKHTGRSKFDLEGWLGSVDEPWQGLLRQWMEYKIQRRERYKTELGARKCLTLLQNLSAGDARVAQMIINQSIASNYAGLFPLKRGYGQIPTPHGAIPGGRAGEEGCGARSAANPGIEGIIREAFGRI